MKIKIFHSFLSLIAAMLVGVCSLEPATTGDGADSGGAAGAPNHAMTGGEVGTGGVATTGGEVSTGGIAPGGATTTGGAATTGGATTTGGAEDTANPLGRPRCRAPEGVSGSPRTIEEAVALINALPKPTSVACFVESLQRPLAAYATASTFSAQPAQSSLSPRLFLRTNRLWLSVVMDGDSSYLIEFGELLDDLRSVKGELKGPFTEEVKPSAPYERVLYAEGNATVCGACHRQEERLDAIGFAKAFTSAALRPSPSYRVSIDQIVEFSRACDWASEPHRCEMLSAVVDGGPIFEEAFPDAMPTFF